MSPEQIHILLEVAQRAKAAGRGGKEPIYAQACQQLDWSRATLMRRLKDVTVTTPRKRRSDAGTTSLSLPDAQELSTAMMEGYRANDKTIHALKLALKRLRASSISRWAVCWVFFWKQCSTYTASASLATYTTRNVPASSQTRSSIAPAPIDGIGLASSGCRPCCTLSS